MRSVGSVFGVWEVCWGGGWGKWESMVRCGECGGGVWKCVWSVGGVGKCFRGVLGRGVGNVLGVGGL